MALINCPECGKPVSDQAKTCPDCGYRLKKRSSKPVVIAVCIVCLAAAALITAFCMNKFMAPVAPTTSPAITDATEPDNSGESGSTIPQTEEAKDESVYDELNAGDDYTFGKYYQNEMDNGEEDIDWIVLDKKDGKVLLLSKYALDCKPYNEGAAEATWETCSLREWLNDDFLKTAFSAKERSRIVSTSLENKPNSEYGNDGGNDTEDKVFILGEEEYDKYSGIEGVYICSPTLYAVSEGGFVSDGSGANGAANRGSTLWWLRAPGGNQDMAMSVCTDGLKEDGYPVDPLYDESYECPGVCVRPAIWITVG